MPIENYYTQAPEGVRFSRRQASDFAKRIAGDFNPLHDQDAKLFCVPGDLLFSLVCSRYGISQRMRFTFSGMVGDGVPLQLPETAGDRLLLTDSEGKEYLKVDRDGDHSSDPILISALTTRYVQFSGRTFPDILVPLMAEHGVMINPARPLVIYESMEIDMQRLDVQSLELELADSRLEVNGKRGRVQLTFHLLTEGQAIGSGSKYMSLRGLRPFEQEAVQQMVDGYMAHKQAYDG
ncbi:MAG TPA: DUF3581 family protein [Sedimenticola sp.]|nr:DUF3581 family protein [Sedimenticola sp.]